MNDTNCGGNKTSPSILPIGGMQGRSPKAYTPNPNKPQTLAAPGAPRKGSVLWRWSPSRRRPAQTPRRGRCASSASTAFELGHFRGLARCFQGSGKAKFQDRGLESMKDRGFGVTLPVGCMKGNSNACLCTGPLSTNRGESLCCMLEGATIRERAFSAYLELLSGPLDLECAASGSGLMFRI